MIRKCINFYFLSMFEWMTSGAAYTKHSKMIPSFDISDLDLSKQHNLTIEDNLKMLQKLHFLSKFTRSKHDWIKPRGYDTGIQLYNCITRTQEPFIVRNKNFVTWYTCGPTVYDSAHVGHACCYVKLDTIQRILRNYYNLNLVTVMNITDVDDKLIKRAETLKVSVESLAKQYEKEFWHDLDRLHVQRPSCVVRVTENLDLIRDFIKGLVEKKLAYQSTDKSIYFDVKKHSLYGKLIKLNESQENSISKKNSMDFALWKSCERNEEVSFESPWGSGRPGWHIECSALASHIFGSSIDVHCGGMDLKFPHHENEEAQCCALFSTPQWVNYWLHTGHLHLKDSVKMSKSLKNTLDIDTMLKSTPVEVFRMACTMSHYRSPMEFTPEFMETAANLLRNYSNFINSCKDYACGLIKADVDNGLVTKLVSESAENIYKALSDDFNTPSVINSLNELIAPINALLSSTSKTSAVNTNSGAVLAACNLVRNTLVSLGIVGGDSVGRSDFTDVMDILNEFRQDVRQIGISTKNVELLKLCDGVRDELNRNGIHVKDYGKKSSWSVGNKI